MSNVQFESEDVLNVLEKWEKESLEDEHTRSWISVIPHTLISPAVPIGDLGFLTSDERGVRDDIFLTDKNQRGYAHAVHEMVLKYGDAAEAMIKGVIMPDKTSAGLEDLAREYHNALRNLATKLPMLPVMNEMGPLNEDQTRYCIRADVSGDLTVYVNNRLFAPNFQRDTFYLDKDFFGFIHETRIALRLDGIVVPVCSIDEIQTKVDYVGNVIEPLVWNARDHAFNPENDIEGRLQDGDYTKAIFVYGFPEKKVDVSTGIRKGFKIPTPSGNYVIRVRDNGFGIPEDVLPYIFGKGVSTKKDTTRQHGVGLYGVKEFVEKNGGSISVKSELGKGTTFEVKLPYSSFNERGILVQ